MFHLTNMLLGNLYKSRDVCCFRVFVLFSVFEKPNIFESGKHVGKFKYIKDQYGDPWKNSSLCTNLESVFNP